MWFAVDRHRSESLGREYSPLPLSDAEERSPVDSIRPTTATDVVLLTSTLFLLLSHWQMTWQGWRARVRRRRTEMNTTERSVRSRHHRIRRDGHLSTRRWPRYLSLFSQVDLI